MVSPLVCHRGALKWFTRRLLIGPERSGTGWHIDPIGCAWNALIHGRKRWAITAPGATLPHDTDVVRWFSDWHKLREQCGGCNWFDFIQSPGEVVYVPQGWGHAVVNLELSVALTGNAVRASDARQCVLDIECSHPELAARIESVMHTSTDYCTNT